MENKIKDHLYVLILCGGGGTRLWPRSRRKTPKQFINLLGNKTIFSQTMERARGLVPDNHIFVVTNFDYVDEVLAQGGLSLKNAIAEPRPRNTALAMATGAAVIEKIDPKAVIINLPSDHLISPLKSFIKDILKAAKVAFAGDWLATIGIKPTFPHTGLGYIHVDEPFGEFKEDKVLKVEEFKEKPNLEQAEMFMKSGQYYWNAGIYIWKARNLLKAYEKYAPKIFKGAKRIQSAWGSRDEKRVIDEVYAQAEDISVDYAISEKADNLVLIPASFSWSDIGDWQVVFKVGKKNKANNMIVQLDKKGEIYTINSSNNLVQFSDRLLALVDVEGLVIIDTPDVLLVCKKQKAQDVKKMVELLKEKGKLKYL